MPKPFDENENEFIPLNDASQFIPGRPHGATIWRWCLGGIRHQGTGGGTVDWMSSSPAEKQIANTVIFNVKIFKIEQLNESGNNYNISGSGNNAISERGNVIQVVGDHNKVPVDQPKDGFFASLRRKFGIAWKWFTGSP